MSTTDQPTTTSPTPDRDVAGGDIVATAGTYYRRARYIMAALLLFGGLYFLYDGYVGYPKHNAELEAVERQIGDAQAAGDEEKAAALRVELTKMDKAHPASDIRLQKQLGYALPPVALALLAWTLYRSRGQYRLSGDTLHIPGHPPVKISEITEINNTLWERKGIANIKYATAAGQSGEFKLDDFVYDRKPTDAIYDRILAFHQPASPDNPPSAEPTE